MSEKTDTIVVGEVYTGKVLKIKPFGAIVSLPGSAPGLVHISQIANGFVQNVGDVLSVGDEVNVRILTKDAASGKISLSMKDVRQAVFEDDEYYDDDEEYDDEDGPRYIPQPVVISAAAAASFEEKFKSWQKISNERIAGINKRNKRR
jgi:predicted RNA-binding protein with RPS1 domain